MEASSSEEFVVGKKLTPRRNIRLVKVNYIKEFAVLGQGEDPLNLDECFVDLKQLQAREEAAIRQAEMEAERIGVGVTSEAQNIFDALAKTCYRYDLFDHMILRMEDLLYYGYDLLDSMFLSTEDLLLPVRWDRTVIVVMNEVRVSSPYHPENVTGGTPAANERVKKVVDFERKRLRYRGPGH
ncbi:hypothetical protein IFM89_032200 [Coptis chinensis]|uniref:AD domain-containing protein n=1 Tax=Coptis chinensis TaxID=261450 RepID=A0A835MJV9_9MAGN|nr:hypothetical protein IFM89_032200 [Coptis chinensis]